MNEIKLTPEQEALIANAIRSKKPYILKLEQEIDKLGEKDGELEVRLTIKDRTVVKMFFFNRSDWYIQNDPMHLRKDPGKVTELT